MEAADFFTLKHPIDPVPMSGQIRIATLSGFPALAQRLGHNPRQLLEHHGIDHYALASPDSYIDCQSFSNLLEDCSRRFNDPLFGLRLAQQQVPDLFGCVTALCRSARNVRDALNAFIDFIPVVHAPMSTICLWEHEEIAELRWGVAMDLGINLQANYKATLMNLKLFRLIAGHDFQPLYVQLISNPASKDFATIEQLLGCEFKKTKDVNAIGFPRELLYQSLGSTSSVLYKLLGKYLSHLKQEYRLSFPQRVADLIRSALPHGSPSIEQCSRYLDVSVRTIQSRLREDGLRYCDIVEQVRIEMADIYLRQEQLPLHEVASHLGFSEQSSFGRAFKRWKGVTPREYRQKLSPQDLAGLQRDQRE